MISAFIILVSYSKQLLGGTYGIPAVSPSSSIRMGQGLWDCENSHSTGRAGNDVEHSCTQHPWDIQAGCLDYRGPDRAAEYRKLQENDMTKGYAAKVLFIVPSLYWRVYMFNG